MLFIGREATPSDCEAATKDLDVLFVYPAEGHAVWLGWSPDAPNVLDIPVARLVVLITLEDDLELERAANGTRVAIPEYAVADILGMMHPDLKEEVRQATKKAERDHVRKTKGFA